MSRKEINDRLGEFRKTEQPKKSQEEVRKQLAEEKETALDFASIAEELQKRHEEEKHSLNDKHVKMTIYVDEDLAKAFNALCIKRGDQKKHLNAALADYIQKRYRELQK